MKKNLFYLFALVFSMSLFTACSDDDDNNNEEMTLEQVIDTKLAGTYAGSLDIVVNDQAIGTDIAQSITLSKSSSSADALKLEMKDFNFETLAFDIAVEPCTVTESNGIYVFSGSQDVTVGSMGTFPVTVAGTINGNNISIDIDVEVALLQQTVNVVFEGTKN